MNDDNKRLSNWTFGLAMVMLAATALSGSTDFLFVAGLLFTLSSVLDNI